MKYFLSSAVFLSLHDDMVQVCKLGFSHAFCRESQLPLETGQPTDSCLPLTGLYFAVLNKPIHLTAYSTCFVIFQWIYLQMCVHCNWNVWENLIRFWVRTHVLFHHHICAWYKFFSFLQFVYLSRAFTRFFHDNLFTQILLINTSLGEHKFITKGSTYNTISCVTKIKRVPF